MEVSKRIVIWCGDAANQKALANKIHKQFGVAAIIIDNKEGNWQKKDNIFRKLFDYVRFKKINDAWRGMLHHYETKFKNWPDVPLLRVSSINTGNAKTFTEKYVPHLIVVSGTGLVKEPMLNISTQIGIVNLHTGLSPYVKGGPNCTNWCIANNDWHLIGNTIMWINAGIDSGNIITSEVIDVKDALTLKEAHIRVIEHAHELYLRAIEYLLQSQPPFNSVPQEQIDVGRLFLTKMWNGESKSRMLRNWKKRSNINLKSTPVKTVPLSQ